MTNTAIILGNMFSLCAMVSDSISGTRKKRNDILAMQTVSQFFFAASSIVLKGYSSTVQNAVSVFRNVAAMKNVKSRLIEYLLILAGVLLGLFFNNRGWFGFIPILANLEYSIAVFWLKEHERALKLAFVLNSVMFVIFNAGILNYVGAVSSLIVAVTTAASVVKDRLTNKDVRC